MKNNRCKRLLLSVCAVCLSAFTLAPQCAAFSTDTHHYVTDVSLGIVDDVEHDECSILSDENVKEKIIYFSKRPDVDENDGLFMWHYYNPITERNFVNGKVTALTKFNDHYSNALKSYKKKNMDKTWEELGRSLHFLEDINTPVHTNSQDIIDVASYLSLHLKFESFVLENQDKTKISMMPSEFIYFKQNTPTLIAKKYAHISANNFYALYNDLETQDEVAANSLSNAQECVSGILYKFCKQVNS